MAFSVFGTYSSDILNEQLSSILYNNKIIIIHTNKQTHRYTRSHIQINPQDPLSIGLSS